MMAIMAAALSGCRKTADAGPAEKVRIGFLADPLATLLYLADATGSFSRNGLEVSFHAYEGGAYAIQDMVAGTIDLAAATEYALVHWSFRQRDLRSFATIATANNAELLARSDRGIEGPRDLRDRRIGVSTGMTSLRKNSRIQARCLSLHRLRRKKAMPCFSSSGSITSLSSAYCSAIS